MRDFAEPQQRVISSSVQIQPLANEDLATTRPFSANAVSTIQQLAGEFSAVADAFGQTNDAGKLERLRSLRCQMAEALLALAESIGPRLAESLNAVAASCMKSGIRALPRDSLEDELFARCRKQLASAALDQVAVRGLAAMLLAWHAFELEVVPSLLAIPATLRASWLSFLLELPPAFAHRGDGDRFVQYLQQLCDRLEQYLRTTPGMVDDIATAFFNSAIFAQGYFNELNLRHVMRSRGALIEDILTRRGANLDQLRVSRKCRTRPRIGFVTLHPSDGTESVYLAGQIERLNRKRFDVRLYSCAAPTGKVGALCRAAAETYVNLTLSVESAVARLRQDDLDVAIFCTNLTALPHVLTQIAAYRVAPIQAASGASPVTTGLRNMDVMISGSRNETENSQDHYTERLVCTAGALNCYPFHYVLEGLTPPGPVSRAAHSIPEDAILFFSGANFYKILPELSEQWFRILSRVPNSYLMLMPFNPNWATNYPLVSFNLRLRGQAMEAGVNLDRIRLHPPVPTIAHVHKVMELADIYLDAFPFAGACSLYDALEVGMPIVARGGTVCRSRHSKAILEQEGLGDWVASDAASYVARAVELGRDAKKRAIERERLARARQAGLEISDTAAYAATLMSSFDGMTADWNMRVETLHATEPSKIAQRISELASEAAARLPSFTDRDLVVSVVLPYLRSGGSRRLIDVGACMGAMTQPFLAEGWQSVLFEPDERCHQQLSNLVETYRGQARLERAAVTADRNGSIQFHLAGAPGLSGLSSSPFAVDVKTDEVRAVAFADYIARNGLFDVDFIKIDAEGHDFSILSGIDFGKVAPRLIMVEFGDEFAGQDRASINGILQNMRGHGYRACVVCSRALGQFERRDWRTSLLAIGTDTVPPLPTGFRLFGNILFFREEDPDFLPSLCEWLEQAHDWVQRGLMSE
jgi:FkbM family methyltransferase